VKNIREFHSQNRIHFEIKMDNVDQMKHEDIINKFKLEEKVYTSNLVLFNADGKLQKYENVLRIIQEFYEVRLDAYGRRKEYLLK
jgi:DNA topoisomerase II